MKGLMQNFRIWITVETKGKGERAEGGILNQNHFFQHEPGFGVCLALVCFGFFVCLREPWGWYVLWSWVRLSYALGLKSIASDFLIKLSWTYCSILLRTLTSASPSESPQYHSRITDFGSSTTAAHRWPLAYLWGARWEQTSYARPLFLVYFSLLWTLQLALLLSPSWYALWLERAAITSWQGTTMVHLAASGKSEM